MADTAEFFNSTLPEKFEKHSDLAASVGKVFQFDITEAGTWTVDMRESTAGTVTEGAHDAPDCVITCAKEDWESLLDNPGIGMKLFMTGKLTASDLGLATQLQKILE
jgi:putative sterol carrier protein